jgi:hypothetical protein
MRLLRAAVFTAVCVALSAAGHEWAGGRPVPLWTLAVAWAAVFAVAAPLAGRERSLPGIAALLGAGEFGLHLLFGIGGGCAPAAAPAPRTSGGTLQALAGHLLCGANAHPLSPSAAARVIRSAGLDPTRLAVAHAGSAGAGGGHAAASMSGMAGMGASLTPAMIAGHLAAALAAGWLLRCGEAALWRIVRLAQLAGAAAAGVPLRRVPVLARLLLAGLPGAPSPAGPRTARFGDVPGPPRPVLLRHALARRGPPAAFPAPAV